MFEGKLSVGEFIVVMDGVKEPVCEIISIPAKDLVYIKYNKGKASSCRKKWTISRESILRKALPHEIKR